MTRRRVEKGRRHKETTHALAAHIDYDRADEKRKIQEEIEDFLEEREEEEQS